MQVIVRSCQFEVLRECHSYWLFLFSLCWVKLLQTNARFETTQNHLFAFYDWKRHERRKRRRVFPSNQQEESAFRYNSTVYWNRQNSLHWPLSGYMLDHKCSLTYIFMFGNSQSIYFHPRASAAMHCDHFQWAINPTTNFRVLSPNVWQTKCKILKCTSEKNIFPPQNYYMKETSLGTGSGLT